MSKDNAALIDWAHNELFGKPTGKDALEAFPGLTLPEAHRARMAVVERRIQAGDALVGYKIASGWSGIPSTEPRAEPIVNSLMRSGVVAHCGEYRFAGAPKVAVEAECAVLLARDLEGPGITPNDVLHAVEGYLPAIEIVPQVAGPRNPPHRTLLGKFTGGIVLGAPLAGKHGLDIALEGAVMRVNGVPRATGTTVNIMGSPLIAVAEIANRLAAAGLGLKAGMVLMTGTITGITPVATGDLVEAAFTRLGSATVHMVP